MINAVHFSSQQFSFSIFSRNVYIFNDFSRTFELFMTQWEDFSQFRRGTRKIGHFCHVLCTEARFVLALLISKMSKYRNGKLSWRTRSRKHGGAQVRCSFIYNSRDEQRFPSIVCGWKILVRVNMHTG